MRAVSAIFGQSPNPGISHLLLGSGLLLGLAGDLLISDVITPGLGLALWMALLGFAASGLARYLQHPRLCTVIAWSMVAFIASLTLALRITPVIIAAMLMVMATAAAMVLLELRGTSLPESTVMDHLYSMVQVPLQAVVGTVPLLSKMDLKGSTRHPRFLAIIRGLFIALPLVMLFGALFSQADAGFEGLAAEVLSIFSPQLPQHLVVTFAFGWLSAGLLSALCQGEAAGPTTGSSSLQFRLGVEETVIIMGALCGLFLTFVMLQLPYLFGGRETIDSSDGLTLAQYARRGFFELVVVACLTLGVLLVMAKVAVSPRAFRPLATLLLVCVLIVLLSALQRLFLYTQAFGLTLGRITAFTVMIWIACCLALFGLIILRGKTRGFALGMTGSAITLAFLFAAVNPAVLVARVNTRAALLPERSLDAHYLMGLDSSAIPLLINKLPPLLGRNERCLLSNIWLQKMADLQRQDNWRSWNLVRRRALRALLAHEEDLTRIREGECRSSTIFFLPGASSLQ